MMFKCLWSLIGQDDGIDDDVNFKNQIGGVSEAK